MWAPACKPALELVLCNVRKFKTSRFMVAFLLIREVPSSNIFPMTENYEILVFVLIA